ncbi:LOW QUALITY PROTEIN: probably inactive receptor-like protein kinase At2g46850 [Phoenix dactylifera]|uniref:LOW QUALITY PROTEIN: probably inactive receptor-like protein kinase At2g46850 n=1 Tax=Phoenix dactylifera TaxID=42345 RepID=A0A8B7CX59_PHODC|nr:LOW QUALITY PROTEIN: probably inactive receptor-like protein kinase At2g46850 [Phoenix dactylifera]
MPGSFLLLFSLLPFAFPQAFFPNKCGERCGHLPIPFPFHLNSSCGPAIDSFRLSCSDDSTPSALFLTLGSTDLRVIDFLPSGSLLLDYSPNSTSSCDPWYSNVNRSSFVFDRSPFFAVTADNVLRLYACEDSSVCKTGCDRIGVVGGCDGKRSYFGCCYPLSDGSVWKPGDGFSVFAEYGCRGFSSWVVRSASGRMRAERGIELEWAVPRGYNGGEVCSEEAVAVNSTAVRDGLRCACGAGFVGDGFAEGIGCFKSCSNDGQPNNGKDCCKGKFCRKRVAILTGVLVSAFFLAATIALCFILRQPIKANMWDLDLFCLPKILGKACNTRQFTYQELKEATKGFEENQKFVHVDGTVHTGVLNDGSLVAVQKVKCETQQYLREILERVELLSQISHRNIARIIGFCFDSNSTLLLVHEYFSNGALDEHLQRERGNCLSWYFRLNIAAEVACALVYLQHEISTPIYLQDLKSSEIFLDIDYSAKIVGFNFLNPGLGNGSCSYVASHDSDVVFNFGLLLLELITGSKHGDLSEQVLPKINEKKFHEIVDPCIGFSEQSQIQREQIERVAGLAVQCLSSKEGGGPCMVGVMQELLCIVKENVGSSSGTEPILEETFSNSSLLQMISMSPDSIHLPSGDKMRSGTILRIS